MPLNLIKGVINELNNEISIISKEDNILRKMEEYYKLFKTEQTPEVTCKKDKKEEKKDKFQLCVVQGGEEVVNAEVTTDEFLQIMHEQAEEENK